MRKSEFAASHDELKEQLHKDSDKIKNQIREELYDVSDQFKGVLTNILIVGGSAAVGYWLIQKFGPWKPKKIGQHRSRFRRAGESLMSAIMLSLLGVARDKLVEYLENLEDETEPQNDPESDTE